MMATVPHVTTVGLPTRGSSGNPGQIDVGDNGLIVYFSLSVRSTAPQT
jgi:hypothetical protein